jgi:hypothetical protein
MDPVFVATREELHDVQMELKRIHHVQQLHGERLRSLEKRQADDAALKSVWNSPFPSVLGGTPQHGEQLPFHVRITVANQTPFHRADSDAIERND